MSLQTDLKRPVLPQEILLGLEDLLPASDIGFEGNPSGPMVIIKLEGQ